MRLRSFAFFIFTLLIALTFSVPFQASAKSSKLGSSTKTSACSAHHLKVKTCSLKNFGLEVHVTESKISLFDGVWRELEDFPFPGEEIQWHTVQLRKLGPRNFLEIKVWDKPVGEAAIQSLVWFGYEIQGLKLIPKWKEVVQKRTLVKTPESAPKEERPKGQFATPDKPRYLYDKVEKHSLSLDKDGVLTWRVGHRKHTEKDK